MNISALLFSESSSSNLGALAVNKPVASLTFAGRYRLIDFALSNIVNAGIYNVALVSESHYRSLFYHLGTLQEWDLNRKNTSFQYITPNSDNKYSNFRGSLDKINASKIFLEQTEADLVLIIDSSSVMNINLKEVINSHLKSKKDLTIVFDKAKRDKDIQYSMVADTDGKGNISSLYCDYEPKKGQLEDLGVFVISKKLLLERSHNLSSRGYYGFLKDFILDGFNKGEITINSVEFKGIVLRNNTIEHYLMNNLKITDYKTRKAIFKNESPIYTRVRDEIPTYFGTTSSITNSVVSDGCTINGKLNNSIISRNVKVDDGAYIKGSIIMANCTIESGAYIENAIIEKDVHISKDVKLIGTPKTPVIIERGSEL